MVRWLNNLKEGSWITVEGMNSHSGPMVRQFEVDEFTGRKARLAEEARVRREQQLAEQRRKDAELKEKQRQEELANKNKVNTTTGGNNSLATNSGKPPSGSNTNVQAAIAAEALPVNMRKPLEDKLNQVDKLIFFVVVDEPVKKGVKSNGIKKNVDNSEADVDIAIGWRENKKLNSIEGKKNIERGARLVAKEFPVYGNSISVINELNKIRNKLNYVDQDTARLLENVPDDKLWAGMEHLSNKYISIKDYLQKVISFNTLMNTYHDSQEFYENIQRTITKYSVNSLKMFNMVSNSDKSIYNELKYMESVPGDPVQLMDTTGDSFYILLDALKFGYEASKIIPAYKDIHNNIDKVKGWYSKAKNTLTYQWGNIETLFSPEDKNKTEEFLGKSFDFVKNTVNLFVKKDITDTGKVLSYIESSNKLIDDLDTLISAHTVLLGRTPEWKKHKDGSKQGQEKKLREFIPIEKQLKSLSSLSRAIKNLQNAIKAKEAVINIPENVLTKADRDFFIAYFSYEQFKSARDIVTSAVDFQISLIGDAGKEANKYFNNTMSAINSLTGAFENVNKRLKGLRFRDILARTEQSRESMERIIITRSGTMRDLLMELGNDGAVNTQ